MTKHKDDQPELFPRPEKRELLHTPVYSLYPPNLTPAEAKTNWPALGGDIDRRDIYPPLDLTVEQLPGTTWVNVPTGCIITCGQIVYDNFGYPGPGGSSLFSYDNGRTILFEIGLWWSAFMDTPQEQDRFVVDHWIYINDQASAELIYELKLYRLECTVQGWLRHQEAARRGTTTGNDKETALAAVAEALAWADQHGFSKDPVRDLQSRLEGKPVQLDLF